MISRPDEVVDTLAIAQAVFPGVKIWATERIVYNRFNSVVEPVSPQCNYDSFTVRAPR